MEHNLLFVYFVLYWTKITASYVTGSMLTFQFNRSTNHFSSKQSTRMEHAILQIIFKKNAFSSHFSSKNKKKVSVAPPDLNLDFFALKSSVH